MGASWYRFRLLCSTFSLPRLPGPHAGRAAPCTHPPACSGQQSRTAAMQPPCFLCLMTFWQGECWRPQVSGRSAGTGGLLWFG